MAGTSTFPLYDRLLNGRLAEFLKRWRSEGRSPVEMRDILRDEHQIKVSDATVRRWLRGLEKPNGHAA